MSLSAQVSKPAVDAKFEKPQSSCGFSNFMSNSHFKCPLDVQWDMKVRIQPSQGIGAPAVGSQTSRHRPSFFGHPEVRNDTKVRLMQPSPTSGDMRPRRPDSSSVNLVVENDEDSVKDHKQTKGILRSAAGRYGWPPPARRLRGRCYVDAGALDRSLGALLGPYSSLAAYEPGR